MDGCMVHPVYLGVDCPLWWRGARAANLGLFRAQDPRPFYFLFFPFFLFSQYFSHPVVQPPLRVPFSSRGPLFGLWLVSYPRLVEPTPPFPWVAPHGADVALLAVLGRTWLVGRLAPDISSGFQLLLRLVWLPTFGQTPSLARGRPSIRVQALSSLWSRG
jgi:hypothetical protein